MLYIPGSKFYSHHIWARETTRDPNSVETVKSHDSELGSSDQEASPSAGKNTGVVLVPCSRMEVRPYSYFRWCGYF